jgi:hypothetical protein
MGGACSPYEGQKRRIQRLGERNLRDRDSLGGPDIDRRIILKWIFRNWDVGLWTGSSWLRIGISGRHV